MKGYWALGIALNQSNRWFRTSGVHLKDLLDTLDPKSLNDPIIRYSALG